MPQASSKQTWLSGNYTMDNQARIEQEYKLPLRQWLINKLDQEAFKDVEWLDKSEGTFKIPWTQKHYPNWHEHFEIFRAWAKHKDKYDENNPPDEKKLKGNFRCALHKSVDFDEISSSNAMGQQTGNYKIYRVLRREEVKEKNRQKKISINQSHKHDSKLLQKTPTSVYPDIKMSPGHVSQDMVAGIPAHVSMQQAYGQHPASGPTNPANAIETNQGYGELAVFQPSAFSTAQGMQPMNEAGFVQRSLDELTPLKPASDDFNFALPASSDVSITNLSQNDLLACSPGNSSNSYDGSPMSIGAEQTCSSQESATLPQAYDFILRSNNIEHKELFTFEIEIKYDNTTVDYKSFDCSNGLRIFYGDENLQKAIVELFGRSIPAEGFEYPSYTMPKCGNGHTTVSEILQRTDQGFAFKCDEGGNLWVTRLSQSVLFYFDLEVSPTAPIKLERYKPVKLFSFQDAMKKALHQRHVNGRKPNQEYRLYVGSKPRGPSKQTAVILNITPVAASKVIESVFGPDPTSLFAFSAQNSLDNLLRML